MYIYSKALCKANLFWSMKLLFDDSQLFVKVLKAFWLCLNFAELSVVKLSLHCFEPKLSFEDSVLFLQQSATLPMTLSSSWSFQFVFILKLDSTKLSTSPMLGLTPILVWLVSLKVNSWLKLFLLSDNKIAILRFCSFYIETASSTLKWSFLIFFPILTQRNSKMA